MPGIDKKDPRSLSNSQLAEVLRNWAKNRRRAKYKEGAWQPAILDLGADQLQEAARRLDNRAHTTTKRMLDLFCVKCGWRWFVSDTPITRTAIDGGRTGCMHCGLPYRGSYREVTMEEYHGD